MDGYGEAIAALSALVLYIIEVLRRKRKEKDAYGREVETREQELMYAIRHGDRSGLTGALTRRVRPEHQVE